jgi:hypothetical protein
MKVYLYRRKGEALTVDAYNLCSRRKFVSILECLDGISIKRRPRIFDIYQFCRFNYKGYEFGIHEDDWDYTFCFSSETADFETFNELAKHFKDYELVLTKPRKTSVPLVLLLSCLLVFTIVFAMSNPGQ